MPNSCTEASQLSWSEAAANRNCCASFHPTISRSAACSCSPMPSVVGAVATQCELSLRESQTEYLAGADMTVVAALSLHAQPRCCSCFHADLLTKATKKAKRERKRPERQQRPTHNLPAPAYSIVNSIHQSKGLSETEVAHSLKQVHQVRINSANKLSPRHHLCIGVAIPVTPQERTHPMQGLSSGASPWRAALSGATQTLAWVNWVTCLKSSPVA